MKRLNAPADTFRNRQAWRGWLNKNHSKKKEIWLVFYKKHTSKKSLAYTDAVEEALCFGWIDGMLKRIDSERHKIRFSPRRPGSLWAPSNIARVRKMIRAKKMIEAGLKLYRTAKLETQTAPTVKTVLKKSKQIVVPPDLRQALAKNPKALANFKSYPPSFRLLAINWVKTAKHEQTRQRRIRDIATNAAKHAKPAY